MTLEELRTKHQDTLDKAKEANRARTFFAHWPEPPSGKIYGENANADGEAAFHAKRSKLFDLPHQKGATGSVGSEVSPFGLDMGISYPFFEPNVLIGNAEIAQQQWSRLDPTTRAAVLVEALERCARHFFEIGYATMHTTGQGFVMAFQASGPHAFDRALEAVAAGLTSLDSFAEKATWVKPMGKISVTLEKSFRIIPRGINVTIGCSTFPLWNSFPGMFASLVTGNATIAKTHPQSTLPMAIAVASFQQTLVDLGLDPHTIQLAVDSPVKPIALDLIESNAVKLVDYTGSSRFGNVVEEKVAARRNAAVFSEKAGVNNVIIDSVSNLDAVLDNLAFSVSLYGGQMCTAPQNFFVPAGGVTEGDSVISFDEVAERFAKKIDELVFNPKVGPGTLGAINNPETLDRIARAKSSGGRIVRDSELVEQPGFENARTVSPLVLTCDSHRRDIYGEEWFGPISFLIPYATVNEAIDSVADLIETHGALSTALYTTNADVQEQAESKIVAAGAPLAVNFTGPIWVNQSAAFSDFHGTGANAAGSASFTDPAFVANRFHVVGVRVCN